MDNLIKEFNKKYFTKKEIKYRIPKEVNLDEIWNKISVERKSTSLPIPLKDQNNNLFWFNMTDTIKKNINYISESATQDLFKTIPQELEVSVIVESLIDEAYNSSVIEGAFSTKKRTKELVEKDLQPRNKSEKMILNNFYALKYILGNMGKKLNEDTILEIYELLTKDTLNEDEVVKKYRTGFVGVYDNTRGNYVYIAPEHSEVQDLMIKLVDFIDNNQQFHPLIKSCIIHFYFVYVHPFFDGNGRTARAISYMYLLQHGYDFFKFFSISSLIKEERNRYYNALENTEIYGSDMTYFIEYYLEMIVKSIKRILEQFKKEFGKRVIKDLLDRAGIVLSKRQNKLISHFINAQKNIITIEEYSKKYKVVYETARTDLNTLVTLGFLGKSKVGKKYIYKFNSLEEIMKNFNELVKDT